MAVAVAARFRVRPRGWSRLLPRRNRLLSMASCQSVRPNLYRSGSAIGAQSLTSGISGARRAASGAAEVPPPIYEYGQTHGRVWTRLPAHHAGPRLKQTTLLARRLADATQIRLVRPEADPQTRRPEVALQRLLEAPLQGLVRKQFVVALRNFKNEVLVVAAQTLDKAFSSTPSKPPPKNPALRA